jgi:hypothetical protein
MTERNIFPSRSFRARRKKMNDEPALENSTGGASTPTFHSTTRQLDHSTTRPLDQSLLPILKIHKSLFACFPPPRQRKIQLLGPADTAARMLGQLLCLDLDILRPAVGGMRTPAQYARQGPAKFHVLCR